MTTAGTCFQLLKPGLKSKYVTSVQHMKKIQQKNKHECTNPLNSSEGTSARVGGKEDRHEALKRTGKKHIFTGLSNRVALHSAAEKESLLTFKHF